MGGAGGAGDFSTVAEGGGLRLRADSFGIGASDAWTVDSCTIASNRAVSGNGGAGGTGVFACATTRQTVSIGDPPPRPNQPTRTHR